VRGVLFCVNITRDRLGPKLALLLAAIAKQPNIQV
jgi:hypothetical protein